LGWLESLLDLDSLPNTVRCAPKTAGRETLQAGRRCKQGDSASRETDA